MSSTLFLSNILFLLLLAWFPLGVLADDPQNFVECAPATLNDTEFNWWNNNQGLIHVKCC